MKNPTPVALAGTIVVMLACVSARAEISSPLAIPGSVLWLDGDDLNGDGVPDTGVNGTLISNWTDKAPGLGDNTVTVSAGAPTVDFGVVGTHNAVRFTGSSADKLDNTAFSVAGDYTVFTVVRSDSTPAGTHVLSGINNDSTDTVLYRGGDGAYSFYSGVTTGNTNTVVARRQDTTFKLFGYQVNSAGGDTGLFQSIQTPFEANGGATGSQLNGIRIGNLDRATPSNVTQSEAWNGHIGEVIIYNRKLTPTEVQDVSKYLNSKYALGAAFATGAMTEVETGHVTGGTPSTLSSTSAAVVSGRINAALSSNGGLAFAKDYIGPTDPRNFRPARLNDGLYADPEFGGQAQEPWIAATNESFAGVKLSMAMTIDQIGFQTEFPDRRNGAFIFEYTLADLSGVPADADLGLNPGAIAGVAWQPLDVLQIQDTADTRHLYSFAPIQGVTGIRVRFESSAVEVSIAELEVWAVPEPGTGALTLVAGLGLLFKRRRRA